ncbi:hypothetical protein F5878DRAFT_641639 [Lentinula raphanica]|uniref:Uncharacterized protein n=1 Tax=Lentinula raphanica TaxID=153919 RepID=A0AA38P9J9_9AGAR|nr:hypothetical protein F5878DRAFT_641639 [Lentinula raphanica]
MIDEAGTQTQDAYAYWSKFLMVGSNSSGTAGFSNHWNYWYQTTTRPNIWSIGPDEPIGPSSTYSPWLAQVLNHRAHARAQSRARVDTRAENGIQFSRVVPAVWPPMRMWPALGYTGTTTSSKTSSEACKFKFDPFADDDDDTLPASHDYHDAWADSSDADTSESTNASPAPANVPLLEDISRSSFFKGYPFADNNNDLPISRSDSPSDNSDMDISTNSSPVAPALVELPPSQLDNPLPPLVESHNTESEDESVPDWCSLESIKMRIIERRTVFDIHESDIELVQRATGLRRLKALAPKPFDPDQIHMSDFMDRPMDVQAVNDVDRFFNKGLLRTTHLKWYEEQDAENSNRGTLRGKVTSDAKLEQLVNAKYTRQRGDGENRGELLRMLTLNAGSGL